MSNQDNPRVNIQFSLDLDELPSEVSRLLARSQTCITAATQIFTHLQNSTEMLTSETWEQVEELRMRLSKADLILDDVHKIVGGYLQMQTEQYSTSPNSPTADPQPQAPASAQELQSQHPDRTRRGTPRNQQVMEAQNNLAALMKQMQQAQANPSSAMTAEEEAASEIMKKRMQRVMGEMNEEPPESTEPSV